MTWQARCTGGLLAWAFTLCPIGAHAEPLAAPAYPSRPWHVELDSRFGTSTSPYPTTAFPEVSGYALLFNLNAEFAFTPQLKAGARWPLVLARLEQPAGALYAEAAWGNPELNLTFERPLGAPGELRLRGGTRLAVGLPLAEDDTRASQLEGRALALANALEGFGEPELYTPGVLPITPAALLELDYRRWQFAASLKLPLLPRVSDANLPVDSPKRPLGFVPVLELRARLRLFDWLALGAAPRLTMRAVAPIDDGSPPLQLLAIGQIEFRFGPTLQLAALFQAPVGGPLGGSTFAGGLRLDASF